MVSNLGFRYTGSDAWTHHEPAIVADITPVVSSWHMMVPCEKSAWAALDQRWYWSPTAEADVTADFSPVKDRADRAVYSVGGKIYARWRPVTRWPTYVYAWDQLRWGTYQSSVKWRHHFEGGLVWPLSEFGTVLPEFKVIYSLGEEMSSSTSHSAQLTFGLGAKF